MNPKKHVILLSFSTLLAAFSLGSIISFTDPTETSWITFTFFYISLFLVCLGIFTLIGLGLRQWLWPKLYVINLGNSFRQAILISLLIVASFMLLAARLMFWWVEATMILFLIMIEGFLNLKV